MESQSLAQNAPPARTDSASARNPGPVIDSDYQTFLKMLTAQMRNQDPLNPMEASDFAVQLATFSGVEQQVQSNRLLEMLISRSGLADMGNWVGKEVGVPGEAWFDGSPVTLAPAIRKDADSATLVVRDSKGNIVDRIDLSTKARDYVWEGNDRDGEPLPEGYYSFVVESRSGDTTHDPKPATAFQRVEEVRFKDGSVFLVLPGGLMMLPDEATGLRAPKAYEST